MSKKVIHIRNEEHSVIEQNRLFRMGYRWQDGPENTPVNVFASFLIIDTGSKIIMFNNDFEDIVENIENGLVDIFVFPEEYKEEKPEVDWEEKYNELANEKIELSEKYRGFIEHVIELNERLLEIRGLTRWDNE